MTTPVIIVTAPVHVPPSRDVADDHGWMPAIAIVGALVLATMIWWKA